MKTKEQLVSENAELSASVQTWSNKDATRRKRFAMVLKQTDNRFGIHETPRDLSWEEIFCELGKLIGYRDFRAWKDDIEFRVDDLRSEIKSKAE